MCFSFEIAGEYLQLIKYTFFLFYVNSSKLVLICCCYNFHIIMALAVTRGTSFTILLRSG